jgi:3-phosphoshikimate 1-carboxyvinyltransferase
MSDGDYRISGVARMHERPIGDLVDGLRQIGAHIDYLGQEGFPPLALHAARISVQHPILIRGNVSSQFLTALLIALPLVAIDGAVIEIAGELISQPYVAMTLHLMARFGVTVRRDGWTRFYVPAAARYRAPGRVAVEGDASSASYFLAAGAIGGGPVRVTGVGRDSIQGDVHFARGLAQMGAHVSWGDNWIEASCPLDGQFNGQLKGQLTAIDLDCNLIPDAAMTFALVALFAQGQTTLRNIGSWRVKETDRLAAMTAELRKLGACVEVSADSLRIASPHTWPAVAAIDTYDDHRMAMCFSLASLAGVAVTINDPGCVAKTFPDYFARFLSIVQVGQDLSRSRRTDRYSGQDHAIQ